MRTRLEHGTRSGPVGLFAESVGAWAAECEEVPFAILGQDDVAFLLKKLAGEINGLGFAETDLRWRGRGAALEVMLPCGNAPGRNGTLGPLYIRGRVPVPFSRREVSYLSRSCPVCPVGLIDHLPRSDFLRTPRVSARCICFLMVSALGLDFVPFMSRITSATSSGDKTGQVPFVPFSAANSKIGSHFWHV